MESYDGGSSGLMAVIGGFLFIYVAIFVLVIVSLWKIFSKAGKPGWAAIIPIYNLLVLLEIVGKPAWWFILFLIPFVNFVIAIIVVHRLSVSFGQGVGMTVLMLLLPFIGYPVLAFGGSTYGGPPKD